MKMKHGFSSYLGFYSKLNKRRWLCSVFCVLLFVSFCECGFWLLCCWFFVEFSVFVRVKACCFSFFFFLFIWWNPRITEKRSSFFLENKGLIERRKIQRKKRALVSKNTEETLFLWNWIVEVLPSGCSLHLSLHVWLFLFSCLWVIKLDMVVKWKPRFLSLQCDF